MKRLLAGIVGGLMLVGAAWAAAPEGRFASPDGAARVAVLPLPEGGLRVEIEVPGFGPPLRIELIPRADGRVLEEPMTPLGWFDRLMSRQPERLPFDGRRLAWATRNEDTLVVNTLQVDAGGHPDLRRADLTMNDDGGVRIELRRYADMDAREGPHLILPRVGP